MLEVLKNSEEFKKRNQEAWKRNTNFWLSSELRQLTDTKTFLLDKLPTLISNEANSLPYVVDMGTGSGWLLELLKSLSIKCNFIGLDFNELFINHLNVKFADSPNTTFIKNDFEDEIPEHLINTSDVVFNFFNFFEIANLEKAFSNAVKLLKPKGKLVILTIDYVYLILALAKNMDQLKLILTEYDQMKNHNEIPFFFQKIDLGFSESEEYEYPSVLYSFNDYYLQATNNYMKLVDYFEIVKTAKPIPKVYQYMVFQK